MNTQRKIYQKKRSNYFRKARENKDQKKASKQPTKSRIYNLKKKSFARTGTKAEREAIKSEQLDIRFSTEEMIHKFEVECDSKCYLTGEKIDTMVMSSWSADHIVPKSKGGDNSLENCGLAGFMANQMKSNLSYDELLDECEKILNHSGRYGSIVKRI
jgi:CRISPR/Cas system Type II protein with McrA/HNH and RuvC-like nuclease domain